MNHQYYKILDYMFVNKDKRVLESDLREYLGNPVDFVNNLEYFIEEAIIKSYSFHGWLSLSDKAKLIIEKTDPKDFDKFSEYWTDDDKFLELEDL